MYPIIIKIVFRLIGIVINIILGVLSYVVPKNERLILLGSHDTFAGNTKAFYLYCIKNSDKHNLKVYWMTSRKDIYNLLNSRGLPVLYIYTLGAFKSILRAKYLLFTHGPIDVSYFYFLFGRFNMIQTWHGIALKDVSREAEKKAPLYMKAINHLSRLTDKKYKLILATSEETARIFKLAFSNENVKILGYPRNDVFYNPDLLFEDYKEKLNLYKYTKVILYCPTYRENRTTQPFSEEFLNKLNTYLIRNNYIFLIKRHPYDYLFNIFRNYSNIIDVSKEVIDIQDLLVHVDILISDYSSIIFDFVLLNRPIIFYPYDIDMYIKNCRRLNYDYFEELPGPFAIDENELLDILYRIDDVFKDIEYQHKYKLFRYKFNEYDDGKSCERLLNYLINFY